MNRRIETMPFDMFTTGNSAPVPLLGGDVTSDLRPTMVGNAGQPSLIYLLDGATVIGSSQAAENGAGKLHRRTICAPVSTGCLLPTAKPLPSQLNLWSKLHPRCVWPICWWRRAPHCLTRWPVQRRLRRWCWKKRTCGWRVSTGWSRAYRRCQRLTMRCGTRCSRNKPGLLKQARLSKLR